MTMRPLEGVKVLDLSRVLAGPLSAMVLADLGANVIKVERPETGDGTRDWGVGFGPHESTYFHAFNRSKRSVTADLGSREGQALVRELARGADIVVENFLPGTLERFGLGYDDLRALNPALVYCAISGYDSAGPEAARAGYDLVLQGESGVMATNGEPGRPPLKFGLPVVDLFTGMYAAQGMLAALFSARQSGVGSRIDVALADCGLSLTSYYGLEAMLAKAEMPRYGNMHSSIVPYGVFEAEDGPFVLAAGTTAQYRKLCISILERSDLADDPRFASNLDRVRNRVALETALAAEFAQRSRDWLLGRLAELGLPSGRVAGLFEALDSERAAEMTVLHDIANKVPAPGFLPPWRLDGARPRAARPPLLGEHDDDIRARLWD
ncbi:MAG: CoA transferase [Hyphomicrobiales bacterium]|nr:MAG: CoA transferase [Hyphomicrobiales bacterium]